MDHSRASGPLLNNTEPERYLSFALSSVINTALENSIRSIALPAIGTGVFKFPPLLAATITAQTFVATAKHIVGIDTVRICVTSEELREAYQSAFDHLRTPA
jgi:O-acetyl-ADP-ribose deacetylase (regulator of RNase III)